MTGLIRNSLIAAFTLVMSTGAALADTYLKPFVLAYTSSSDVPTVAAEVKSKLTAGGYQVVGEYSPYKDADVIIVTNDALKAEAAKTDFGGYGAMIRVSVTRDGDNTEVAYTNPEYTAAVYRMAGDMADIKKQIVGVLGDKEEYGTGDKNLTAKDLRDYHYTVMMEYFTDPSKLAEYDSYDEATKAVEAGLAAGKGATSKVYRIDIPGKNESVFGVALHGKDKDDCSGDDFIMSRIDKATPRSTAHLPYEILVKDGTAYALYARFRIAIDWPHLPMVASKTGATFMSIMCSPGAIEEALTKAAGGED